MVQRRPLYVATRAAYVLLASCLALFTACAADPGTNTAGGDTGRDRPVPDAGPDDATGKGGCSTGGTSTLPLTAWGLVAWLVARRRRPRR